MTWQVVAAVLGAWCVAIGAAAQERPATAATGDAVGGWNLVVQLLRSPRWLAGCLVTVIGMALHLAALATAPLSIVQPLGISGMLVAVWVSARWSGRTPGIREVLGAVAVSAGLIGLVVSMPYENAIAPQPADGHLAVLSLVAVPLAVLALVLGRFLGPTWRAGVLAAVAGVSFGVTAALVRVVVTDLDAGWSPLWHWRTAVAVGLAAVGGLVLQNAYRAGRFSLSYALLLVVDPVVAAGIGVVFLSEPLPTSMSAAIAACLSIAVLVAGVATLAGAAAKPTDPYRGARPVTAGDGARVAGADPAYTHRSHSVPSKIEEPTHVRPNATFTG